MALSSFTVGQRVRASELNALVDQINSLTAPGWTTYTPAWTSSGTAPAIGNGILTGKYRRATNSDFVIVTGEWQAGTTTTFGTGLYSFSVPLTAVLSANTGGPIGAVYLLDSGTADRPGGTRWNSTTTIGLLSGATGDVGATTPWTWANGDKMQWTVVYQV